MHISIGRYIEDNIYRQVMPSYLHPPVTSSPLTIGFGPPKCIRIATRTVASTPPAHLALVFVFSLCCVGSIAAASRSYYSALIKRHSGDRASCMSSLIYSYGSSGSVVSFTTDSASSDQSDIIALPHLMRESLLVR
jgi:hypothetical protein